MTQEELNRQLSMNELAHQLRVTSENNGWDIATMDTWVKDPNKIATKLALVHSEVSEALEALRKEDPVNFDEEIADAVIRLLELCDGLGIDIYRKIVEKDAINQKRGFKHGGKRL